MKKIFTLLCAAGLLVSTSATAAITKKTVTNQDELKNALNAAATTQAGDISYIYVQGDINLGSFTFAQHTHNIHLVGINDEETGTRAQISAEFVHPTLLDGKVAKDGNEEGDKFAVIFENLRLRDNNGPKGNSKHFFNCKDSVTHYVDSLVFRNCEIYDLCRSFYRTEPQAKSNGTAFAGNLNYFEMTNCNVHQGFIMDNAMPFIYIAQPTTEMKFENNTFYDMPYLNSIVSFGFMNEKNGRRAIKFTFNNNTVIARTMKTNALFSFAAYNKNDNVWTDYVDLSSEYHFKNNFFLCPTWADDWNNRIDDKLVSRAYQEGRVMNEEEIAALKDRAFTFIHGGLVQIENNVLSGYTNQTMYDDIIPIGDTEADELDDFSSLAMADVPFEWSDFVDAEKDMFDIQKTNPAYTAGKNGAPLGNINNYTDKVIKLVSLTTKVEGSTTAKIAVNPEKATYQAGDVVKLSIDLNGSLNEFEGWNTGDTDTEIEITLDDDTEITATCKEISYLAVWNLDDITGNNVVKTPPVTPNHGDNTLTLNYARYDSDATDYKTGAEGAALTLDGGTKAAIQTRNNKVSGDVRNCYLIQTATSEFAKTADANPDYLFVEVPQGLQDGNLQFFVASDNVPYKTYNIDYTTNGGTTWTNITNFTMENRASTNEWYPVSTDIPTTTAATKIRIIGVPADGPFVSETYSEGGNDVASEFLFVTEIILKGHLGGVDGIQTVQSNDTKTEAIYNLQGIKVKGNAKGLYIKGNKKFVK